MPKFIDNAEELICNENCIKKDVCKYRETLENTAVSIRKYLEEQKINEDVHLNVALLITCKFYKRK